MGCCGQGRAALRAASTAARESSGSSRAAEPAQSHATSPTGGPPPAASLVRYLGNKRVRVRGAVSGRAYEFSRGATMTVVSGDVPGMVRTGLFVRG
jgi:hypothetical protein